MKNRQINRGTVTSIALCAALVCVGFVRMLSYSQGPAGDFVRHSFLGILSYDPSSRLNAQFFKILATPAVVAGIYFFFRWRNAGVPTLSPAPAFDRAHRLDFESWALRGILTSVITLHWLAMEWWKFHVEGFYPWSELESRWLNVAVLIASQALAFWGMRRLSFDAILSAPWPRETSSAEIGKEER